VRIPAGKFPAPHNQAKYGQVSKVKRAVARGDITEVRVGFGKGRKGLQVPIAQWDESWVIPDSDSEDDSDSETKDCLVPHQPVGEDADASAEQQDCVQTAPSRCATDLTVLLQGGFGNRQELSGFNRISGFTFPMLPDSHTRVPARYMMTSC
jgi:hypothetical protein